MEHTADEIKGLQDCISNLISALAMPAIWSGHEASMIVSAFLDVLVGMLRLDFGLCPALRCARRLSRRNGAPGSAPADRASGTGDGPFARPLVEMRSIRLTDHRAQPCGRRGCLYCAIAAGTPG